MVCLKKMKIIFSIVLVVFLTSCMPMGNNTINKDLFKGKEDIKLKVNELKMGMSEKEVFNALKIAKEKFTYMSTYEVQGNIYGNSIARGDLYELEQFKKKMMSYKGYYLPYREIKSDGSLGFGTVNVNKHGYDLKLVIVFEKNKLILASVNGAQNVNINENHSMLNSVLRKTTGFGF